MNESRIMMKSIASDAMLINWNFTCEESGSLMWHRYTKLRLKGSSQREHKRRVTKYIKILRKLCVYLDRNF